MLNKVSVTKADIVKNINENENIKGISALVTMEDQFTWIHYMYTNNKKIETLQKKIKTHPKISDYGKMINFTRIFYDKIKKSLFIIIATNSKLMIQEVEDAKNLRILYDTSDNDDLNITGYYEGYIKNTNSNINSNIILLKINETNLIEIDLYKNETLSSQIISSFILKNNIDIKSKLIKYEIYNKSNPNQIISYQVMTNYDENKNIKTIWKMTEKIICIKFRPKTIINFNNKIKENLYNRNNHLAISLEIGKLRVFHYESKIMIYEYRTTYGNVIGMDYSPDGRLLGLCTESDNVYILDAEFGRVLFCLEGHKNYVTSINFEIVNEEDNLENHNQMRQSYDSIDNFNQSIKTHPMANKEITNEFEFLNFLKNSDDTYDMITKLKRTRTHNSNNLENVNTKLSDHQDLRMSTTFDVYTAGLDGFLSVWRIEHFYEDGTLSERNYVELPFMKENVQIIKMEESFLINLIPKDNIKISPTDMIKISKSPLNFLLVDASTICYISRRNTYGSFLFLNFLQAEVNIEDKKIVYK